MTWFEKYLVQTVQGSVADGGREAVEGGEI